MHPENIRSQLSRWHAGFVLDCNAPFGGDTALGAQPIPKGGLAHTDCLRERVLSAGGIDGSLEGIVCHTDKLPKKRYEATEISEKTLGVGGLTNTRMSENTDLPRVAVRLKLAREAADLSQPQLAERVGMSQQGIQSIEAGKVMRPKKLKEIARAVGRSEEWLLGSDANEVAVEAPSNASFPPQYQSFPQARIPLLGQTSGGANGRFILNGQDPTAVFCPPGLEGVRGAYAVLVYGESMEPKFEAGETVWLHPYLPVRRGDYVVAQILGEDDGEEMGSYIKQFVSHSSTKLVLRQFNPAEGESELLEFSASKVFSVHKIVFHQLV